MIKSKLTGKAQTTIPQAIMNALRLRQGDEITYVIEGDRVILTKSENDSVENPFATSYEWSSDEDREAYLKL